jgi:hypothetical protein
MTLGVYLLGALEPADRSAFESHLAYCDICRGELVRLAPLPGLLNQITAEDFADDLPSTAVTAGGPAVVTGVHQGVPDAPVTEPFAVPAPRTEDTPGHDTPVAELRPRRRFWKVAAAAAAVVVLAIGGVFAWGAIRGGQTTPPAAEGVTWSVSMGAASAQARMIDHRWGTEIQSRVQGLPPGKDCYLMVYDHYGNREVAGWWGTDHDPDVEIPGSVSMDRGKIDRLEYLLENEDAAPGQDPGDVVLTIQAPGR